MDLWSIMCTIIMRIGLALWGFNYSSSLPPELIRKFPHPTIIFLVKVTCPINSIAIVLRCTGNCWSVGCSSVVVAAAVAVVAVPMIAFKCSTC